ncbi:viroplasmin family protein [Clostridium tarantellae]|uniref:Ribonuclease HI n=1 Tax=Clostridium tarantellae TaxID=39493 RepID=A0A6I1MV08_9CLOT|nr:ribonuclease H family protein [Clostridium tarantellae]MPQ44039.1 ribonuclease HI [Clostridium tarantellae]
MGKKVYAIKEGYDFSTNEKIKNKIVNTWAECLKCVKGVKGAKYKSFESMEEAKKYLNDNNKLLKKGIDNYPEDYLHIYVDGSYNMSTKRYAYGVVAVRDNVVEHIESGSPLDTTKSNIRQIAGELEGAVKAVEYALKKGEKKVVLFHDYEGIFHHATGSWDRREESSEIYYDKMNKLFKEGIEVIFVKVDSHTGDLFNELADERCKKELNIVSDKVVEKWLKQNKIYVCDEKVKEQILELASKNEDNIIVKNLNKTSIKHNENKELKENNIIDELIILFNDLSLEKKLDRLKYAKYINKK